MVRRPKPLLSAQSRNASSETLRVQRPGRAWRRHCWHLVLASRLLMLLTLHLAHRRRHWHRCLVPAVATLSTNSDGLKMTYPLLDYVRKTLGVKPLCKDCKWAVAGGQISTNFPAPMGRIRCKRPHYPNRVSGVTTYLDLDAYTDRSPRVQFWDACGPEGFYFTRNNA
jgi:hypothetical protein